MMKKIFIFIFLLGFIDQAQAYDCQFDKLKPGVTNKSLEEINIFALYLNEPTIFTKLMLNITEQYPNIDTKNYLLNLTKTEFSSNYHLPSLVFQDGFC